MCAQACDATRTSGDIGRKIATRSPGSTPSRTSASASRVTSRESSANVSSRREPSSPSPTDATAVRRRSAQRWTQFQRDVQLRRRRTRSPTRARARGRRPRPGLENSRPSVLDRSRPEPFGIVERARDELPVGREPVPAHEPDDVRPLETSLASAPRRPSSLRAPTLFGNLVGTNQCGGESVARKHIRRGEPEVVDAGGGLVRPVHDHARQHGRERRAAVDPARPRPDRSPSSSGSSRATRSPSARSCSRAASSPTCSAGGGSSSSASSIFTASSLACGLAGGATRADRRARRPGPRRGADEPGDALDHHRHLPAAPARNGDRHLGRRLRARARDRPARRRHHHRAHQLELDLLHQRPGRRRSGSSPPTLFIDESRDTSRGAASRRPGPRHLGGRPVRAHLRR